ncbi:MAG: PAS domain S-box protein [Candidatus Zixiibacteriota bacterium]
MSDFMEHGVKTPTDLNSEIQTLRARIMDLEARVLVQDARIRELCESEQGFRQLAESIRDVFWLVDWIEQRVIYVSPHYEAVWGRPPESLYQDTLQWIDAIHPDDREAVQNAYLPASVAPFDETYRIIRPDGSLRWIHDRRFPIRNAEGVVYRIAGIAEDVTEYRLALDALRESEARYRSLYEDNPSMYFTVAADGTVLSVNKFGAQQLGYTVRELVGRSVFDVFHPEDREEVRRQVADCLKDSTRTGHWEFRKIHRDGHTIHVEEAARSIKSSDGRSMILVVCEDITERRQIEEALRQSEERFRTLTSLAPVGIFLADKNQQCLFVNERWCELAGMSHEEALGQGWQRAVHPQDLARISNEWSVHTDQGDQFSYEFRFNTRKGEVTWLFGRGVPLCDDDQKVTGWLGTITDITERKKAEVALRASEERYRAFYESNPCMFFTVDPGGNVISVNKFGAERLGYRVEELVGRSVLGVLHEDDRDLARRQLADCVANPGTIARWRFRKRRRDGAVISVREAARAIREGDGRIVVLIVCDEEQAGDVKQAV